jgi:uncharacterized membrane protein YcfT
MWIVGAPTILAYPTILVLHTVGLAMVVGTNAVLDLRLLGVGEAVPIAELKNIFRPMWAGFAINAASGLALFVAAAVDMATKPVFYIKLGLILLGLVIAVRIRRLVFGHTGPADAPIGRQVKVLAAASLTCWAGAITAGRLMAYIH